MSEPLKPKAQEEDALPWGQFFHREFQDMKIRTNLNQWENLSATQAGKEQIARLIAEMILECKKSPFNEIKKSVIQRIIHQSAIEDKPFGQSIDFTGYSVRWLRSILNAWWAVYGDKIILELQRAKDEDEDRKRFEEQKANADKLTQKIDVDFMLESYRRTILASKTINPMSETEKQKKGAEWTSGIERKASMYSNGLTVEQFKMMQFIDQVKRRIHKSNSISSFTGYTVFEINGYDVYARNEKQAREIFEEAELMFKGS